MAVFRAGPWGTLNEPYQPRPDVVSGRRDFGDPDIGIYPINVANNVFGWSSFCSVKKQACPGPDTVTATSLFSGTQQLTREFTVVTGVTVFAKCTYYWVSPYGAMYGQLEVWWDGSNWKYTQSLSSAAFLTATGGTDPYDPTGEYTDYSGTYTVTTPETYTE